MMTVSSGNGAVNNTQSVRANMNMQSDPVSKGIQDQIMNAQKQLQELSANKDMTSEEKMKRRQEIQQEIANLNQQLRQRQIDKRKEQQEQGTRNAADKEEVKNSQKTGTAQQNTGLSQASMEAMVSADSSMKQAKVQGSVATRMEDRAGVLKIEIKLDGGRGGDTSAKQTELAEVEQKAENAANAQLGTLAEANRTMADAAESDRTDNKADNENEQGKTDKTADGRKQTDGETQVEPQNTDIGTDVQPSEKTVFEQEKNAEKTQEGSSMNEQKHIDIRL